MARRKELDGIQATVERLYGNDDYRSILTKLVKEKVFKNHLQENTTQHTFKRSDQCDNLIKNVLLLTEVFHSDKFAMKVIEGKVRPQEIHEQIKIEKEKMDAKFKTYGYWLNRLSSLDSKLSNDFDMETASLEDLLEADKSTDYLPSSVPYALRAVKLLEKVEEEGRFSQLSPEQQTEKAWAMYRLGIEKQALDLAYEVTKSDPTNSEAWLLLAMDSVNNQREATQRYSRYSLEAEDASPLSSHERWAEEMQDEAVSNYFDAKFKEKEILFNALLHWPKSEKPSFFDGGYRNQKSRNLVLNLCVNWLFNLLEPYNNYANSKINLRRAYEMNGLEPEFMMMRKSLPYLDNTDSYPPHGLNEVELSVAKLICDEFDEKKGYMFSALLPNNITLELQLLHVRYALNLDNYNTAKQLFDKQLSRAKLGDIHQIITSKNLINAFATHSSRTGIEELLYVVNTVNKKLDHDWQTTRCFIELNFYRKSYDYGIARGLYEECISIAKRAKYIAGQYDGQAPNDVLCDVGASNKLTSKFWKYLEILAACNATESGTMSNLVVESLLSVQDPKDYFSNEPDYMSVHSDYECYDEWYVPPYGDSILESGKWQSSLEQIATRGEIKESKELERAFDIIELLNGMKSDNF